MTNKKTLELALEALKYHTAQTRPIHKTNEAIKALEEALAKQEQELALQKLHDENERLGLYKDAYENQKHLYVIGIDGVPKGVRVHSVYPGMKLYAHPQQKQEQGEPVAYIHRNEYNEYRLEPHDNFDIKSIPFNVDVPLFKSPQQRKPLTDVEVFDLIKRFPQVMHFARAIEAAHGIKEKNT